MLAALNVKKLSTLGLFACAAPSAGGGTKPQAAMDSAGGGGAVALLHQSSSMGASSAEERWTIHTLAGQEAASDARNNLAI